MDEIALMNFSLTPELEKIIAERVASGRYASSIEVIREALRLLEERDHLTQLRHDVRVGLEQLERGRHQPFDDQTLARIKSQGRKRAAGAQRNDRAR